MKIQFGAFGLAAVLIAGCTPAMTDADIEANLHSATASAPREGVDPAAVTVTNRVRTQVKHTWTAGVGGKSYACDVDDQFAWPSCTPQA